MTQYPWTVKAGTLLSQSINALILGGHPDQSLSSRALTEQESSPRWRWVRVTADRLLGEHHCRDAYEADVQFGRDVADFR